ncbi:MAG: hypothetical protein JL50_12875 [Peptococcaceae bacterium BICA1-7]|nr:MAG: hypothetical protein JL50_12875 [Peptococcaceae bacterium BICA1-7]
MLKSVEKKFDTSNNIIITRELEAKPTTLYLMQYLSEGCQANCAFCVQGLSSTRERKSSYLVANQLLRFPLDTITQFLKDKELPFKRVCIQTILHDEAFDDLVNLVEELKKATDLPISANCTPMSRESISKLNDIGLDRIIINYELVTPELFDRIRGRERNSPYSWEQTTRALDYAMEIFGYPRVLSHLIIGIGETDLDALKLIENLHRKKIIPSLFAFRPLKGTDLENYSRVSHERFHCIQMAAFLIKNDLTDLKNMKFDQAGNLIDPGVEEEIIRNAIYGGKCFMTSGCPWCNRPNYTVDPGERHYTYPRVPSPDELSDIKREIGRRWNLFGGDI